MDASQSGKSSVLRGVRLLSDTQVSITISKAYEPYFYEMALFDYSPYPISVLAPGCKVVDTEKGVGIVNASGTGDALFTADLLQKTILDAATGYMSHPSVVSGPYTLTSYDAQSGTASFAINPYYKGNEDGEKPTIETIVDRTVANDEAIDLLLSGEVDLLNKMVAADTISKGIQSTADQPFSVANYPRSGLSMISFSCERQTVSGKAVRQAIASCFDRDTLVKAYTGNFGLNANGYFGIGQWMYQLAVDMRKTEPGDVLSYCQKWVAFQERWTEVLPAIPVYSNVYFDFYTTRLQNYRVTENQTWTQAIVGATLTQTAE